jgi:hypothetical protein
VVGRKRGKGGSSNKLRAADDTRKMNERKGACYAAIQNENYNLGPSSRIVVRWQAGEGRRRRQQQWKWRDYH